MSDPLEKVQDHYDGIADRYDRRYYGGRGGSYYDHICGYVRESLPEKGTILDLGCGTGLFLAGYIAGGGAGTGLDLSRGMIQKARERCPYSEFTVGTAEHIPFRDNTFDAVSSLLAFSYLREPEKVLAEAYRVIRPGGSIAVCTLGRNLFTAGLPVLYRVGETLRIRAVGVGAFDEHYYRPEEMADLFRAAGFIDICVRRCSFAHMGMADPIFSLARRVEPFVESTIPYLAFNLCAAGKKPR